MPEPEVTITIHGIHGLTTATKLNIDKEGNRDQVTKIGFEAEVPPSEVARILYMQKRGRPIDVVIKSPQAEMDLTMMPVNVKTGEIVERA